jgi:hypothetical protein
MNRQEDSEKEILEKAKDEKNLEPLSENEQKKKIEQINSTYNSFLKAHSFREGQLVKWKEGLKNKMLPRTNEPAVVIKILDTPIFEENENAASPYFKEPLDLIIGIFDEEIESLILFHVDKRRFQPYN